MYNVSNFQFGDKQISAPIQPIGVTPIMSKMSLMKKTTLPKNVMGPSLNGNTVNISLFFEFNIFHYSDVKTLISSCGEVFSGFSRIETKGVDLQTTPSEI